MRREQEEIRKKEEEKRKKEEEKLRREEERKRRIEENLRKQREAEEEKFRLQKEEIERKTRLVEEERNERTRKRRVIEEQLMQSKRETTQRIEEQRETMLRRVEIEKEINNRGKQVKSKVQESILIEDEPNYSYYDDDYYGNDHRELNLDDPFVIQDEIDRIVINLYNARNSQIFGNLPKVSFKKGKTTGEYFIGQRKFKVDYINNELKVIIGKTSKDFTEFIEQQERIQSLKIKALNSAGCLVSFV